MRKGEGDIQQTSSEEESHVRIEAEIGMIQVPVKECWSQVKLGRGKK